MKARRDLVFVSAGLGLDGGGRAAAGRLLAGGCAGFARGRGLGFRLLALEDGGLPDSDVPVRGFAGDQRALALEVWKRQLNDRGSVYVFDLLGTARTQAYLPSPLRSPYLVQLHGIEVWRPLGWDRARALARATVRCAVSSYTLERARPFHPQGLGDASVLPLALEERRAEGAVDALLLGRLGRGFFLIVGRMDARERYKGHDQLLEALRGIPGARLVVAGDGDDRRRLEAKAAGLEMADRVVFTGFTSEATLAELYRRCAAFAMPSRGGGVRARLPGGDAGRQAGARRPRQRRRGDRDRGRDRPPGRSGRPRGLRGALARLLDHPGETCRMGEAGFERWRREFGVERFRERLEPLLERLVAGNEGTDVRH